MGLRQTLVCCLTLAGMASCARHGDATGNADSGLPPDTTTYTISVGPLPVEAGTQAVYCTNVHLGNTDPVDVVGYTSTQTVGGHHLILLARDTDTPDSPPAPCDQSTAVDPRSGSMVYISQIEQDSQIFPPHVGMHLPANASLMLQVHYIDATSNDLEVSTTVNILAAAVGYVTTLAAPLLFYNATLAVPPGQSSSYATCPMSNQLPLYFFMLAGHMHSHGTNFTLIFALANQAPQQIYQTSQWDSPREEDFNPPLTVRLQSEFTWTCDYTNETGQAINEPDEMCAVLGNYYPAPNGALSCYAASGSDACLCTFGTLPDGGL
jgi:hypothetical protein